MPKQKRTNEEPSGFLGSSILTVFLVLLLLALAGTAVWLLFSNGVIKLPSFITNASKSKFAIALEEHNYQAASTDWIQLKEDDGDPEAKYLPELKEHLNDYLTLCRSDKYTSDTWASYRGLEIFSSYLKDDLLSAIDDVYQQYTSGTITKETAKTWLNRIGQFECCQQKLADLLDEIAK